MAFRVGPYSKRGRATRLAPSTRTAGSSFQSIRSRFVQISRWEEGEEEPDAFDATAATPAPTPEHDEEGEEEPDAWPDGGEDRESRHSGVGLAPGWHEQIAAAQQQRTLRVEGRTFERVRYGVQQGRGKARWPCPDCAVAEGQYHVAGCDAEQCPRCGWEGIGCECHRGDDDGLDDDDQLADAADA